MYCPWLESVTLMVDVCSATPLVTFVLPLVNVKDLLFCLCYKLRILPRCLFCLDSQSCCSFCLFVFMYWFCKGRTNSTSMFLCQIGCLIRHVLAWWKSAIIKFSIVRKLGNMKDWKMMVDALINFQSLFECSNVLCPTVVNISMKGYVIHMRNLGINGMMHIHLLVFPAGFFPHISILIRMKLILCWSNSVWKS